MFDLPGHYGFGSFYKSIDTVIMGRMTYEVGRKFGQDGYSGKKNYVFSRARQPKSTKVEFVNRFSHDADYLVLNRLKVGKQQLKKTCLAAQMERSPETYLQKLAQNLRNRKWEKTLPARCVRRNAAKRMRARLRTGQVSCPANANGRPSTTETDTVANDFAVRLSAPLLSQ